MTRIRAQAWPAGAAHRAQARVAASLADAGADRWPRRAAASPRSCRRRVHLPIWVALFGFALVVLRFVLLRRDRARPLATPARIPSWALAVFALAIAFAIRKSYGYFIGRDPCVAFLFVLVGIKFLEVRTLRDGTLLVCLAMFLLITPFFYSQSLLAALAALPAVLAAGRGARVARVRRDGRRASAQRGAPRGGARRR